MPGLTISIATAPVGGNISLGQELRLLKPALLYADAVTLISPVAALLHMALDIGGNDELTLALAEEVGPLLNPQVAPAFARYRNLKRNPKPTRRQREDIAAFKAILAQGAGELAAKATEMLREAGADEILPAVEAGVVQIDPVIRGERETVAAIASSVARAAGFETEYDSLAGDSFIRRIEELVVDSSAYPLFDEGIGDLVRAGVAEGLFEIGSTSKRRGKQVSAATQLMQAMPSFPGASVGEILDIREELRRPLTAFRAAIGEMETLIQSAAYEADFQAEVDDLYLMKVAPALLEIVELIEGNNYLRQLMRAAVGDAKTLLTAVLTMGAAAHFGVPELVAAASGIGIPVAAAALSAADAGSETRRDVQQHHHLFFLYRLEELLFTS